MNFEDLLPYVAPYVGNCPRMTMIHHIRLAAIEFCKRTHAWSETLADVPTVVDTVNYALGLPAGAELVRIFAVDVGDCKDVDVYPAHTAKRELARQSGSTFAWTPDRSSLSVNPVPKVAGQVISVEVSLKPTLTSDSIPDVVGDHHGQSIAHGALEKLLRMPKVDWRDTASAEDELARFNSDIATAARTKTKGYATQRTRVTRFY